MRIPTPSFLMLSAFGLDTEYVDDIKHYVWKLMIMKCTMASICAVTDKTIKEAFLFPPSREIADACFKEILDVAKAKGYGLGGDYLAQALGYLEKVGINKDSICVDIANKTRTESIFSGERSWNTGRRPVFQPPARQPCRTLSGRWKTSISDIE